MFWKSNISKNNKLYYLCGGLSALAVKRGEADAMICGLHGRYLRHLKHINEVIGMAPGARDFSALSLVIVSRGRLFPR